MFVESSQARAQTNNQYDPLKKNQTDPLLPAISVIKRSITICLFDAK